eukprot:2805667-Alexandrium_andersonii.AAC.1
MERGLAPVAAMSSWPARNSNRMVSSSHVTPRRPRGRGATWSEAQKRGRADGHAGGRGHIVA